MTEKTEKKRLLILRVLNESDSPLSSHTITEILETRGMEISERTIRHHLLLLDNEGYTKNVGRQGRLITEKGEKELSRARVFEKVGFLTARIDSMCYNMDFSLENPGGTVIVNISLVPKETIREAVHLIGKAFESGFTMGKLVTVFPEGDKIGSDRIPDNFIGVGTVCSITIIGALLGAGISARSRFGGLLEIQKNRAKRFIEIISYDGSSIDPLEIFIKSKMTDFSEVNETGNCRVGASFHEIPANSREHAIQISQKLKNLGLGGFLLIGWPGQNLLSIPVNEGRVGAITIGGLNAIAILEEKNFNIKSHALSGLINYEKLFPYKELENRIASLYR